MPVLPPIEDIPPEVLLEIFEWATWDDTLLDHTPSWKNYDLSSHDPNDPWAAPSSKASATAVSISGTCKTFRRLSAEFVFRHLAVVDLPHLRHLLEILKDKDRANPIWIKRLSLLMFKEDVWKAENTRDVCDLIRMCTEVEVFSNDIVTGGEFYGAGPEVLKTVVEHCPRLRRLHWRPVGCMHLRSSQWTTSLAQVTRLIALDIDSPPAHQHPPFPPSPPLVLDHLRHLRICVNEDSALLIKEIASWTLPSIENINFRSQQHVSFDSIIRLMLEHGQKLRSMAMDSATSDDVRLAILLPMCTSPLELVFHENTDATHIPHPVVTTIVVCVQDREKSKDFTMSSAILGVLRRIRWITSTLFPSLKRIVVVSPKMDEIEQAHVPDLHLYKQHLRSELQPWVEAGIELVNRRGITLVNDGILDGPPVVGSDTVA